MTKFILFLIFFLPSVLYSQNVAINNDGSDPHHSALLDVSSTTKGVLFPRLTTFDRTSIPGPAIGLTVFDTDTNSYWVYRGDVNGGWREILVDLDKVWQLSGTHIYNLNNGNVGIGTNNPQEKLSVNAVNPNIQLLNSNVSKGFLGVNNHDISLGTYNNNTTGNLLLKTKGLDRIKIDENGLVGIGTTTGTAALNLNGTNPAFQIRNGDEDKGFLKINSDDLILGTNSGNLSGNLNFNTKEINRMLIEPNGDVGIGTSNPNSKLDVSTGNDGQVLRINAADQTFMGIWENNGYRGYVGSYYGNVADIDVGSLAGAVHLVTGSTIDLTAKSGKIGIGTQDPEHILDMYNASGHAFTRIMTNSSNNEVGIDLVRNGGSTNWRISQGNTGILRFFTANNNDFNPRSVLYEFYDTYFRPGFDNFISLGAAQNRWSVVYAGTGTINTSDARDKTNIQNINYGLEDIMKLRPVSFNWKDKPQWGTKLGLIAQEVKDVVGEVVVQGNIDNHYDEDGNELPDSDKYGIYYSDLIPVLIKATQEQQQMIDDLRKEILEMKKLMENR
jgi:hypothetical protein